MDKKIFFFDIDGTLCHMNKVSPRVKKAIQDIRKKGHLCFIASGRPPTFIQEAVKDVGFDGFVLCNGGYAFTDTEILHEVKLNDEYLKPLLQFLKDHNCEYILQTKDACYLDKDYNRLYDFYDRIGINAKAFIREYDEEALLDELIKIEIWPDTYEFGSVIKQEWPHYTWHQYISSNMEMYLEGISKAWGIMQVANKYGIAYEHTYCFGDGTNDIEMLEAVCNSYAMGNASDEVKAHAKNVCPSIEEDGIAVVLETFL